MSDPLYKELPYSLDISTTALEECALRMRPSRSYKLYVHPRLWTIALSICRSYAALVENNPFAPYINVTVRQDLKRDEWFIEGDTGEAWGSKGVS